MTIRVKTVVSLQLEHEDGSPVTTIPLTPEIIQALQEYLAALQDYVPGGSSMSPVELPVLDVGWGVLRALDIPPPPTVAQAMAEAATRPPRPPMRRALSMTRRLRIMFRDGGKCIKCAATDDLSIDHIVPIVKGGSDEDDNLRTLCRSCNSSKKDRLDP
jgi:hypothetical protein